MEHRGVQYTVTEVEPGLWKWRFVLGGRIRTGRTRTNIAILAAKRVSLVIDREQRVRLLRTEHH